MQNEAWHYPAEIDMFLGKVVTLMAVYVTPKFQHKSVLSDNDFPKYSRAHVAMPTIVA